MKQLKKTALFAATLLLLTLPTLAQESETKVVDEVIAQVNEGVITLSRIKRESKGVVELYVQEGKKRDEAQRMVDEKQGEIIANLINEELLIQRAKELGLEQEIDASMNQRFVQIMKQYNMKTLDALYEEMRKQGVEPDEIKTLWRQQATREVVLQAEVQRKLYWEPTPTQVKEYYDKNRAKFGTPETVTLSEVFLSFAGREEAAVREKAKQLLAQARNGADFQKLALENSDNQDVAQTKGKVGTLKVNELNPNIAKAINNVKQGGIAEPVEDQVGIHIIRVDERSAASAESKFDESAVRMAMMNEKIVEAQKKYLAKLREDAYIKISDSYRPMVAPILFADERTEKPKTK
jgi:parvulin-like peptidyl-prolyl isomerase